MRLYIVCLAGVHRVYDTDAVQRGRPVEPPSALLQSPGRAPIPGHNRLPLSINSSRPVGTPTYCHSGTSTGLLFSRCPSVSALSSDDQLWRLVAGQHLLERKRKREGAGG